MKAIETTGIIDPQGNIVLDEPIQESNYPNRVKIIILFSEVEEEKQEEDPDDTTVDAVKTSLKKALQQVKAGQTRPISELWNRINDSQ